jgi:hypothetical protein
MIGVWVILLFVLVSWCSACTLTGCRGLTVSRAVEIQNAIHAAPDGAQIHLCVNETAGCVVHARVRDAHSLAAKCSSLVNLQENCHTRMLLLIRLSDLAPGHFSARSCFGRATGILPLRFFVCTVLIRTFPNTAHASTSHCTCSEIGSNFVSPVA